MAEIKQRIITVNIFDLVDMAGDKLKAVLEKELGRPIKGNTHQEMYPGMMEGGDVFFEFEGEGEA